VTEISWFDSGERHESYPFSKTYVPPLGPNKPALQWVDGLSFPGINLSERESDYFASSIAVDMNECTGTSTANTRTDLDLQQQ
jgi:hypothetical protein